MDNVAQRGDAAQLLRDAVLDNLSGLGAGSLRDSYEAIVAGRGRFYLSGVPSKGRGIGEADLDGKPAELAPPARLVQLVEAPHPDLLGGGRDGA